MTRIGFIGLGHMGNPMATHFLEQGFPLYVYDRIPAAVESLVKRGAISAINPAALAESSDVIITMLQTGEQVSTVCLGPEGLFEHARANTLIIDSSSIDVARSRQLHELANKAGLVMVDAPVSGGVAAAKLGSLTVMVGGTAEAYERAKPILSVYGKNIIHAGVAGNGQVAKICNNMILGISMIAVSEAYTLGKKLGLPEEKLFEISSKASGQCWSMTSYSPVPGIIDNVPSNNQYQPGFTAQMMLKDLRLSQEAAQTAGAATPLGAAATSLYTLFVNQGQGDLDFSGIIKLLK
jgi:3-hydroxyisobutyrate dehydrogenase